MFHILSLNELKNYLFLLGLLFSGLLSAQTITKVNSIETDAFDKMNPQVCVNGKVRKLSRITASIYDAMLRPHGLQGSQLSVLFMIGKKGKIHQKALGESIYQSFGWIVSYKILSELETDLTGSTGMSR